MKAQFGKAEKVEFDVEEIVVTPLSREPFEEQL